MNCGPKSFRWVMELEGIDLTIEQARELCQTTNMGTREPDLRAALVASGFETELRQHLNWEDLSTLSSEYYLFVMYQCHYSVVVAADSDGVDLYDPDYGTVIRRARADFEPLWYDYEEDMDWTHREYDRAAILVRRKQPVRPQFVPAQAKWPIWDSGARPRQLAA